MKPESPPKPQRLSPRIFVAANFVVACCWAVARLPQPGETLTAGSLTMEPGGKGLNVAIATRRLGAEVEVLIGIGSDAAGQQLLGLLAAEGIGAAHVHTLAAQSGYGAGFIAENGQNAIAVFPGANLLLDAAHADAAEGSIAAADLVYGQFETSVPAVARSFEIARRRGVRTVLNPSPWQPIAPALLAATSVIVVNEVEVLGLIGVAGLAGSDSAGLDAHQLAMQLPAHLTALWAAWQGVPAPLLVVTLGAHGCVAFRPDHAPVAVAGFAVRAVDTVGAGDAFAAALCMALCRQTDLHTALVEANAAGALMASQRGVLAALPTAMQLDAQLAAFERALPQHAEPFQASSLIL